MIKFAVIGFGHIGRRHATIIHEYPESQLVAVVEKDAALAHHNLLPEGVPFFTSFEDFIEAEIQADVISITTPNGYHCPYALKALEHGFHVVIEKPMGLSRAECEEVIFKSLQVAKQVFVVKQNRYSPPSQWLKEIVCKRIIGETLMVQINCYWNRDERYYGAPASTEGNKEAIKEKEMEYVLDDLLSEVPNKKAKGREKISLERERQIGVLESTDTENDRLNREMGERKEKGLHPWKGSKRLDGGSLYTQFSHFVDIMYWVFGDIKNIKSTFKDFNHQDSTEFEDSGLVQFEFVNGGLGCINFSTAVWDTNMESSITVVGTKGSLKIGGQYMNEIEYCHIKDYERPELPPTNPPNDYGPFKGSAANHHYVIENVVNTLCGKDTITANALEGMKVVDIIERIYEAGQHRST